MNEAYEAYEAYNVSRSMRVMGPHERPRFAPDAWGHLMKLNRTGILNTVELEHVIERALLQVDGRISLGDLRGVINDAGIEGVDGSDEPMIAH